MLKSLLSLVICSLFGLLLFSSPAYSQEENLYELLTIDCDLRSAPWEKNTISGTNVNIASNGSFETKRHNKCPNGWRSIYPYYPESILCNWFTPINYAFSTNLDSIGSPDYFNKCSANNSINGIPSNGMGNEQESSYENAYVGLWAWYPNHGVRGDYREYVQQELNIGSGNSLKPNREYYGAFKASQAEYSDFSIKTLGMAITNGAPCLLPMRNI